MNHWPANSRHGPHLHSGHISRHGNIVYFTQKQYGPSTRSHKRRLNMHMEGTEVAQDLIPVCDTPCLSASATSCLSVWSAISGHCSSS
jgi:hypothetical protein